MLIGYRPGMMGDRCQARATAAYHRAEMEMQQRRYLERAASNQVAARYALTIDEYAEKFLPKPAEGWV